MYDTWIKQAHSYFREASNQELTITPASEWVLDNYYIIRQTLIQIEEDLPVSFYNQLPKLIEGPLKGLPRIFAIARAVLAFQKYLLNVIDLQAILVQAQKDVPLTMGELWALPIFLRYSLIETLSETLEWIIQPETKPNLPVFPSSFIGPVLPSLNGQVENIDAFTSSLVANIILSLRTISEQNWNDFFEAVSRVEKALRKDPAGVYSLMDFTTRDLYRKEIEILSAASGRDELDLVQNTLALARENREGKSKTSRMSQGIYKEGDSPLGSSSHVGEYLLGKSRPLLEKRIGYHPNLKVSFQRWGLRHASIFYLGSIMTSSLLIFTLVALVVGRMIFIATWFSGPMDLNPHSCHGDFNTHSDSNLQFD